MYEKSKKTLNVISNGLSNGSLRKIIQQILGICDGNQTWWFICVAIVTTTFKYLIAAAECSVLVQYFHQALMCVCESLDPHVISVK